MMRPGLRAARVLSVALTALMAIQSALGLLAPGIYRDVAWIRAAWFGNDIVTLVVAVPALAWALVASGRGSRRGELAWFGMLAYAVYNYAYYLLGARLNAVFPLYVVLFVLAVLTLVFALARLDVAGLAARFSVRTPARIVAGYMGLTGVGLGIAWLAQWAAWVFGGVEPAVGEDAFALIAALDLTLIVPYFILGAVALWQRRPWGYVLGAFMCVKGFTYTLVLAASSTVSATRGIEGAAAQIPIWGAWTVVGVAAAALLLRGLNSANGTRAVT
ncbi:MAG: hypothetical protein ACYDHQ_06070 [Coriobacteriia bacterium]